MGSTNFTEHYDIPLPLGSDKTTPMDYNSSMQAVDTALFGVVGTANTANTNANSALEGVQNITNNVIGGQNGLEARVRAVEGTQTTQGTALANLANTVGDNKQDMMDAICSVAEATATASVQHLVGSYFWYNDTLYKTTQQINVGNTIVPNTNCQTTNITTEILNAGADLSAYQTKSDNSLQTTNKTVVGGINELKSDLTEKIVKVTYNDTKSFTAGEMLYLGPTNPVIPNGYTLIGFTCENESNALIIGSPSASSAGYVYCRGYAKTNGADVPITINFIFSKLS